jgi:hypothetical protein
MQLKTETARLGETNTYLFGLPIHCLTNINKGNNKITELRTILQRESQNS